MAKQVDSSSQDEMDEILLASKFSLICKLTDFGLPKNAIDSFMKTCDDSHLLDLCQGPKRKSQLSELLKTFELTLRFMMTGSVEHLHEAYRRPNEIAGNPRYERRSVLKEVDSPTPVHNVHEANRRSNDQLVKCRKQLRLHYMEYSNILKVALLPSTKDKIHSVQDLHVPVVLKKSEISPDLPQMADIQAIDFFKNPSITKKRILLFGPPGVGKTTEIKMWLHNWCRNRDSPLNKFPLVFYIDGAKLEQGTNLGEAVTNQCLPANSDFVPEGIESMCQECQDEILVILDNYPKWKLTDRLDSTLQDMVLLHNLQDLTLLVGTTSGRVGHFREVYANFDHVKVEGIGPRSVSTYIEKVFKTRPEFGSKVQRYLRDTEQVGNMAASPVLLSIMCQIVKWNDYQTLLGDLKTSSALMDRFIDCIMRHAEGGDSDITLEKSKNADRPDTGAEELSAMRQKRSAGRTVGQDTSLSKDETIKQLSAVAFSCYLKGDHQEELHLSEGDFHDVCGELATEVIKEGCRRGLLVKSSIDEINPSSQKAAEGRIIRFLSPPFQQRLAAKYFAKLLQGNKEEKQVFRNSLQKIGSIDNALLLRNLLLFSCGESMTTARFIIGHVVYLTLAYAGDMHQSPRQGEEVLGEAHGQYQYIVEFILDLNYEARSDGRLNDIIGPLVTQLRILSPSVIMTRSLVYLLEHAATSNRPKLYEANIEVFDVPSEMHGSLPSHKSIHYKYEVDASAGGGAAAANMSKPSLTGKLSIKVNQLRTKSEKRFAPTFPSVPTRVLEEDVTFPFGGSSITSPKSNMAKPDPNYRTQAAYVRQPVQESTPPKKEIEVLDRSQYSIDKSRCISSGGYGIVYEGKWKGKRVAVKRVEKVEKSMTKSLEREIKINALVNHPNIVVLHAFSIYQPGMTSDLCFELIMDLIKGFTLKDAVFEQKLEYLQTDRGKLTTAMKVSDAIAHIHGKGCTHSDIKSDNILIRKSDNEPFVCDLGLSHAFALSNFTSSGNRTSVPKWAAPEAFTTHNKMTFERDVWSLACVLLEMFTGHRLWEKMTGANNEQGEELTLCEIAVRFNSGKFTPDILSLVDIEAVRRALHGCFTKNPQERPSAKKLTEIFEGAVSSVNE